MDITTAGHKADNLIFAEILKQDKMWGDANERADASQGQLLRAAIAQQYALLARQMGHDNAFDNPSTIYPADWSGFRDYGSDVANLVVAVAFLRQEIKRKIAAGESTERLARNTATQPYLADQPNQIEG